MILRIAGYCKEEYEDVFRKGIEQFSRRTGRPLYSLLCQDGEAFLTILEKETPWDMVIVSIPGAMGMEAVISVRELEPEIPLIWCSDDQGFGVESYRQRCSLFMGFPEKEEDIVNALHRCLKEEVRV